MSKTLIHPKQLRKTLKALVEVVEESAGSMSSIQAGIEFEGYAAFEEDDVKALALKLKGDLPASFPINLESGFERDKDDEMESNATFKLWFRVST